MTNWQRMVKNMKKISHWMIVYESILPLFVPVLFILAGLLNDLVPLNLDSTEVFAALYRTLLYIALPHHLIGAVIAHYNKQCASSCLYKALRFINLMITAFAVFGLVHELVLYIQISQITYP